MYGERSKLERSLDDANAALREALRSPSNGREVAECRRRVESIRRTLRQHRNRMEGR